MNSNEHDAPRRDLPVPVRQLVNGLWQQREDLGVIADELLEILRRFGLAIPDDDDRHPSP